MRPWTNRSAFIKVDRRLKGRAFFISDVWGMGAKEFL